MFKDVVNKEEYIEDRIRLTKYYYNDGTEEFNLTVDGFSYIPLVPESLYRLINLLNTLKDDGEI